MKFYVWYSVEMPEGKGYFPMYLKSYAGPEFTHRLDSAIVFNRSSAASDAIRILRKRYPGNGNVELFIVRKADEVVDTAVGVA